MAPWSSLNLMGKVLAVACVINVICAIVFLKAGDYSCIFSMLMAAVCGLSTYRAKYQHINTKDINYGREE